MGRSLPQKISSRGNINSPTASTETTVNGERKHYTLLNTQNNVGCTAIAVLRKTRPLAPVSSEDSVYLGFFLKKQHD